LNNNNLTIGITAYNEGQYLLEAWDSIINQTTNNWEAIMILDGGSDMKTKKVFDDISHPYLRKIKLGENNGPYHCRTLAINNTNTDWYYHLDADDRLPPSAIKVLNLTIDSEPNLDFIRGQSLYFNTDMYKIRENRKLDLDKLVYTLPITGTSPIKVKLFNSVGGYNRDLYNGGADWDFWISVVELEAKGKYLNEIIYERRVRKNSVGAKWSHRRHEVADILIKHHPIFFADQKRKQLCLSKSYEFSARECRRIGKRKEAATYAKRAIDLGNDNQNLIAILREEKMSILRYTLSRISRINNYS